MAMFGSIGSAASGLVVGLVGLVVVWKMANPMHKFGLLRLIAFVGGVLFFGSMVLGVGKEFLDPPPVAPVQVAPVVSPVQAPGGSPYAPAK